MSRNLLVLIFRCIKFPLYFIILCISGIVRAILMKMNIALKMMHKLKLKTRFDSFSSSNSFCLIKLTWYISTSVTYLIDWKLSACAVTISPHVLSTTHPLWTQMLPSLTWIPVQDNIMMENSFLKLHWNETLKTKLGYEKSNYNKLK